MASKAVTEGNPLVGRQTPFAAAAAEDSAVIFDL